MKLITKLKEHFNNKNPIIFKDIIIFSLILFMFRDKIFWGYLVVIGMFSYPANFNYNLVIEEVSLNIAASYSASMSSLFELGLSIGKFIYPYNQIVSMFINWVFVIVIVLFLIKAAYEIIFYLYCKFTNRRKK